MAVAKPSFSWAGLAFIALFYVLLLTPGAVAVARRRSRWSRGVLGLGALAIPVQATGIAQTDPEAVGPLSSGRWAVLSVLFLAMAVVYALQAVLVHRLASSGRRDREGAPTEAFVRGGGRQALADGMPVPVLRGRAGRGGAATGAGRGSPRGG